MSNEQNATPDRPSLLDRIHLFRKFAKSAGWSDVAEWLTKHADEPCPAAIAEFMEMGAEGSEPVGQPRENDPDRHRGLYVKFRVTRIDPQAQARHDGCDYFVLDLTHDKLAIPAIDAYERAASLHGYNKLAEDLRLNRAMRRAGVDPQPVCEYGRVYTSSDPPPSEPSRTEAVKEAIALVERHGKCGRGPVGICRFEGEGGQCTKADDLRPVVAALADAERESVHYKDELAAATKRERALEEQVADVERRLATARKAITVGLRIIGYPADGMPPLEGDDELHALHKFKTTMQAAVAAIDAPAGEEAGAMLTKCNICILPLAHAGSHVNYPLGTQRDAPPPEPANAQGSEAEVCGAFWGLCRNAKPCALHPEPSHPPLRASRLQEARAFADTYDSRNEATLLYYAAMLDRDDALERAAAGALKLLHDVFDFTKRTPQVEATIANLSAVLAQHAGKAE